MAKHNHMLDVAFTVISDREHPEDLTKDEIVAALLRRVAVLMSDEIDELRVGCAIGHCDTFEEDE